MEILCEPSMDTPQLNRQGVLFRRGRHHGYKIGHQPVNEHCDLGKSGVLAQESQVNQAMGSRSEEELSRGSALSDVRVRAGCNTPGNPGHSDDRVRLEMLNSSGKLTRDWSGRPLSPASAKGTVIVMQDDKCTLSKRPPMYYAYKWQEWASQRICACKER